MTLTVTLEPEMETRFRVEAAEAGLTPEELASRRLLEAELLWRIRTAAPEAETRELHRLRVGGKPTHSMMPGDHDFKPCWTSGKNARRMEDVARLSNLRGLSVRQLMERLDVRPRSTP